MGTARTYQSLATELEESGPSILCCAGMHRRKAVETRDKRFATKYEDEREEKVVCVTSGASFLGLAIVSRLLLRGYYVRAIVHTDGNPIYFSIKSENPVLLAGRNIVSDEIA